MNYSYKRTLTFHTITAISILFAACSTADLREKKPTEKEMRFEQASIDVYFDALKKHGIDEFNKSTNQKMKVINSWQNPLVSLFSPLDSRKAVLNVVMNAKDATNDVTEMDETGLDALYRFGVEQDRAYEYEAGEKEYVDSSTVFLYARPMQNYFQWIFTLSGKPVQRYAGTKFIDGSVYDMVYMADSEIETEEDLETVNQYLVYISRETGHITFITYTVREMMTSYIGSLHYKDFKKVGDSMLLPYGIKIGGERVPLKTRYHTFVVKEMTFEKADKSKKESIDKQESDITPEAD